MEHEIPWGLDQTLIVRNHERAPPNTKALAICLVKLLVPRIVKRNHKHIIREDEIAFVMYEN